VKALRARAEGYSTPPEMGRDTGGSHRGKQPREDGHHPGQAAEVPALQVCRYLVAAPGGHGHFRAAFLTVCRRSALK